jgi:hypothetical protein
MHASEQGQVALGSARSFRETVNQGFVDGAPTGTAAHGFTMMIGPSLQSR